MTSSPLVSIALATYCGEKYLSQQMDTLLTQTYPNLEIVVADDGSTDQTWNILHQYASQDSRIRLLPRSKQLGAVQNFARCFTECRGELVSPCDQDDVWYVNKTSRLVESMQDALIVYCNSRLVDDTGEPLGQTVADKLNMLEGSDPRPFVFSNSIHGHAMIFRKTLLSNNRLITHVPHDWWLAFVAANLGRITYLDEVLVDYRRHRKSITYEAATNRSVKFRRNRLVEDSCRLKAMAEFKGSQQRFIESIRNKWRNWYKSYFSIPMFISVLLHAEVTHKAFSKNTTSVELSLKFLVGHKLKHIILPHYYPLLESNDRTKPDNN